MNSGIIKASVTWDESEPPPWMDKINIEELEKLAAIGYTPEKVAMYFNVPKIEFLFYFMLEGSKLKHYYDRGILYYQAKGGLSMLEDADQNAAQATRLDKLRETVQFRNAVDEIFYGGI